MNSVVDIAGFQTLNALQANMESSSRVTHRGYMPLLHAPVDACLRVISCGSGKGMAHRLASMGVTENSIIKITHQAGGNLVIAVENTRLAIEPSIAQRIIVMPVTG